MNATATPGWGQSLAAGAPGIALVHIEHARTGRAGWEQVHRLAREMTRTPVDASPVTACLYYGAPAVAYALHAGGQPAYRTALAVLDRCIATVIETRLAAAHRRISSGQVASAREYDLIRGLTGLGAYLMHRHHDHQLLRDILGYLVRLTQPIRASTDVLPGWWASGSPDKRQSPRWARGHAGFGMAHGIAGPLALLAATQLNGITADGQAEAIHSICTWMDHWKAGNGTGAWWPEVISKDEHHHGPAPGTGPHRPSWCYGTPGIARAQHLAGLATGDRARTRASVQALTGCLTDSRQLAHLTGLGLCHGLAGLIHSACRAHADTPDADLAAAIATASRQLEHEPGHVPCTDGGLLDGAAGIALANRTRDTRSPAQTAWDTCLLTSQPNTTTQGTR